MMSVPSGTPEYLEPERAFLTYSKELMPETDIEQLNEQLKQAEAANESGEYSQLFHHRA
jgi:hypothetical protein